MFFWPHLELTEYEKQFVAAYKIAPSEEYPNGKPGVMRRTYKVLLNSMVNVDVPGLEAIHLTQSVQISRRSRIFALTFSGDVARWRLNIQNASGEQFTPKAPGVEGAVDPRVCAMVPGTSWNSGAFDLGIPNYLPSVAEGNVLAQCTGACLPLIIEPNWQFVPNEALVFTGTPLVTDNMIMLEIGVHAWEFPHMVEGAPLPPPARKKDHKRQGG